MCTPRLTGTKPDDAIERSDEDTLPLPTTLGAKITEAQEKVLLKGLAVQAENRYQTMDAFRDALTGAVQPEPINKTEPKPVVKNDQKEQKTAGRKELPRWLIPACAAAVLVFAVLQIGMAMGRIDRHNPQPIRNLGDMDTFVMIAGEDLSELQTMAENLKNPAIWGQTEIFRRDIKSVQFENTLDNAPRSSWDVSAAQDGSVLAWVEKSFFSGGRLHIAADGIISLNPDSGYLFAYFTNLKEIDFGAGVDTSQVTNMSEMFYDCNSLTSLDLSGFDTSQVTDMRAMFSGCSSLTSLDVSGLDTSQVTV